jgi:hypothetical protein
MTHQATHTPSRHRPGVWESTPEQDQARLELLESLPVRLETSAIAEMMVLAEEGKTARSIGLRLSLDPLVVALEARRESERRARKGTKRRMSDQETAAVIAEGEMPRLTRFEMNRLARGTHIPNQPIRDLIATVQQTDPDLTVNAVITRAGYNCTTHGRRLLGYMRNAHSGHYGQTIRPGDAARVVRALGRSPVEVLGL